MDATQRSLAKFDSDESWDSVEENIPVFLEHRMRDRHGAPYTVDEKRLKAIADEINRNLEEDGCPVKLTEGHTFDPATHPQAQQPDILQWGVGAFVATWQPTKKAKPRPALFLKKIFTIRGMLDRVKKLPERSPEFLPQRNEMRTIALLKTDPQLAMGVTIYAAAASDGLVRYGRDFQMADDPTKLPPNPNAPGAGNEPPPEIDEKEAAKFRQYMAHCYPKVHKYEMGDAENEEVLGKPGDIPPKVPKMPDENLPVKMGSTSVTAHYQRLEAQVAADRAEMLKLKQSLETDKRMVRYERDLIGLREGYGYDLDVAAELQRCRSLNMDDNAFEARKTDIIRYHRQDITKIPRLPVLEGPIGANTDPDVIDAAHQERAVQYSRKHPDLDFEECVEKTRNGVRR